MELVLYTVILLLLIWIFMINRSKHRLPPLPGPQGWLIVKKLLQPEVRFPHQILEKWGKQFNGIYLINLPLCAINELIVTDYRYIFEALISKSYSFAGRPEAFRFSYLLEGGNDILTSSPTNANWKPSRMLIQKTMKMFGNELFKVEDILSDQMNDLVTKVNAFVGKAVDMRDIVEDMVTGTILTLLTGTKSSAYSKQREMMKLAERSAISCLGIGNSVILDKVPWSRFVYYQSIRNYLKLRQALKLKRNLWNELWAESLKTYEIDKPQCVLHVMADMINENSFNYLPQMNETFLRGIIFNFYTGGISTTASSVYALLNILLHHTKVMLNLQKEVDSVTNLSRRPTLADKDKMPYTMATIYELLRYTSVVPLSSRLTLENSTIAGFDIPSNTGIHLLYWAVHHDEEFWGDPWIFRPERFLNTGGKLLAADHPTRKHVLAFGAGMRVCVGEVFALRRLFLFTTYIAQSFNIYPDDLNSMTSCDPRTYTSGLVLRPQSFRIKMKSRN